ncbi:MAG TPA: 2-C-methyl-D-erythritol 4-phosphate cytidylyltransferase, partial [Longimicrobiaceae bacterium]|nr:2-C-methyl-D-erythritol 4-phosphate cytidylyltransferase [Longimicrobiaceae bacterium]
MVVAGGAGRRLGGEVRKQFLLLGGVPVLLRALRPFLDHPRIRQVVVVLPPSDMERPPPWLAGLALTIVAGGAERGDSVWNGLQEVAEDVDRVLIHDGARPLVSAAVIDRVLDGMGEGAAIAAVPVTDTVKEVDADGTIAGTPPRASLWLAQTPQGFPREGIVRAYRLAREAGEAATDDAALYERYVGPVRVVMGSHRNLKVTRS